MLFSAATLSGLAAGQVSCTFRRWTVVRPKVGSSITTSVGVIQINAITRVDENELTQADAREAGFNSLAELSRWTSAKGEGDLYRVDLDLTGPDPRVALRAADQLTEVDVGLLDAKLDRMDAAAPRPWTRQALRLIQQQPEVVARELAVQVGEPLTIFKPRIRRLKGLGLTESLPIGYRLSPRGVSYLAQTSAR